MHNYQNSLRDRARLVTELFQDCAVWVTVRIVRIVRVVARMCHTDLFGVRIVNNSASAQLRLGSGRLLQTPKPFGDKVRLGLQLLVIKILAACRSTEKVSCGSQHLE